MVCLRKDELEGEEEVVVGGEGCLVGDGGIEGGVVVEECVGMS